MHHYTIQYSEIKPLRERYRRAACDARNWFGNNDKFAEVLELVHGYMIEERSTPVRKRIKALRFQLAFAGIQGLPAFAVILLACGKIKI